MTDEVSDVGRSDTARRSADPPSPQSMYVLPGSEIVAFGNSRAEEPPHVGHVRHVRHVAASLDTTLDDSDQHLAEVIADGQQHRPRWQRDAACRGVGVGSFFPTRGEPTELARAICSTCTVIDSCMTWSLAQRDDHGIAAGMSGRQRRQLRVERKRGDAT